MGRFILVLLPILYNVLINIGREGLVGGFTKEHGCKILVYYEVGTSMEGAIFREKQLKGGSRKQKLKLIESMNPQWKDLYELISP
jgi:putative endonuclease